MAGFTPIDRNNLLAGKPFTSPIALAYDENLEAVAEGAPGAWRIDARANAFSTYMEHKSGVGDPSAWTDLDPLAISEIQNSGVLDNSGGSVQSLGARVRASNNNGVSWGSWITLITKNIGSGARGAVSVSLVVNHKTGGYGFTSPTEGPSVLNYSGSLGVTNINAIQVSIVGADEQAAYGFLRCRAEDT